MRYTEADELNLSLRKNLAVIRLERKLLLEKRFLMIVRRSERDRWSTILLEFYRVVCYPKALNIHCSAVTIQVSLKNCMGYVFAENYLGGDVLFSTFRCCFMGL
jgi:hypothetical protein